jgi:O-antigen/teichoic acid export membrane protein
MRTQTSTPPSDSGVKEVYAGLLKHAGIYSVPPFLSRLVSVLVLPVYTRYLQPADYGCLAILDLMVTILGIVIGAGMGNAVTRYHFDVQDNVERDRVWWTGLTFVALMATAMVGPAWLLRQRLASLTLGAALNQGGLYYALVLPTLWCNVIGELLSVYLQVHKRLGVYSGIHLARLFINVGLNLFLLTVLHLGIVGLLLGNLITGGVIAGALLVPFYRSRGPYVVHGPLIQPLWRFGSPLVMTALLATVMHQADRYLLRLFIDLDHIGLYSLAYTIGQAINALYLVPFSITWGPVVYEIARRPDAKEVYVRTFQYFVYGLALVMLGAVLFARPLLAAVVAPEYVPAADLIPIVCLAYLFFSLHEHFKVPVLLAKRTTLMPSVYCIAAVTNIAANLLLIPWLGTAGAAWASVATFATFSFTGLWRYRTIDHYPYPLLKCGAIVAGMSASYVIYRACAGLLLHGPWFFVTAILLWMIWAIALLRPFIWRLISCCQPGARQDFVHDASPEKTERTKGRNGITPAGYVLTSRQE